MKILLFFFILCTFISFVSTEEEIQSHTFIPFSLTGSSSSFYFQWKNNYESSDIFIIFSKATGYTSSIYLYESKDTLREDIKNKSFKNCVWGSRIISKINIITSSSSFQIKRRYYYIYITEPNGFFYSDSFSIFNEQEPKYLKANIPYEIYKFGGKKQLSMLFDNDKSSHGKLYIVNEQQISGLVNITICLNNKTEIINSTTEPFIEFSFNEKLDTVGRYIITLDELVQSENENKINILLIYEYEDKMRLHHEIPEQNYFLQNMNKLYYYINITDYALEQFNILTFEFTQRTLNDKLLNGIYTKIITTKNATESYLKTLMPSQGTDFLIKNSTINDKVYHIYFNKTKMQTENEPYVMILLTIDLNNTLTYRKPDYVKATLSKRIQYESTNSYPSNKIISFNLLDYVPKVIRLNISNINADLSYVLYTSGQSIMTTYNGTVLTSYGLNTKKTQNQIFAISKGRNNTINTFDIIFFGQQQPVNFEIITTRSEVIYFNLYRPTKTFSKELTSCNEPLYIIGSYSSAYSSYMYLHPLIGEFKLYYKNYSSVMQDLLKGKPLFPTDETNAFNSNTIAYPESIMDIIGIKCEYPGWFNFYMMSYSLPSKFNANSQTANFISKSQNKIIDLPNTGGIDTNWKIEINEVINNEITYTLGNNKIILNQQNKTFQTEINSNEYKSITVEPSLTNNIIHFTIANKSLQYETISEQGKYEKNTNDIILFKLKQDMSYQQAKININSLGFHSFMYIKQSLPNELIVPLPTNSSINTITKSKELNLIISNPYALSNNVNDSIYYLLFQHSGTSAFNEKTISFEYIPPIQIETYNESSTLTVYDYNTIIGLNKNNDENNIYIAVDICNDNTINQKQLILSYYNTTLNEYHLGNKYNIFSSKNYDLNMNLHFEDYIYNTNIKNEDNYNGIHLSYFYSNNYETKFINEDIANADMNLNIKGNQLTWNQLSSDTKGYKINYTVLVFSTNSSMKDYFDNGCYLKTVNVSNEKDVIEIGKTEKNSYKIKYANSSYVNVIAHISSDLFNMDVVYKSREVNPNNGHSNKMIWIIGGIVIVVAIIVIIVVALNRKKRYPNPNIDEISRGELLNEENMFSKEDF